jgi:hypothetical protein
MRMLVMVKGSGFHGNMDGRLRHLGFYANRAVNAASAEAIDRDALSKMIKGELLASGVKSLSGAPMSISQVSLRRDDDVAEYRGFSFYPEESWLRRVFGYFHRRST